MEVQLLFDDLVLPQSSESDELHSSVSPFSLFTLMKCFLVLY